MFQQSKTVGINSKQKADAPKAARQDQTIRNQNENQGSNCGNMDQQSSLNDGGQQKSRPLPGNGN